MTLKRSTAQAIAGFGMDTITLAGPLEAKLAAMKEVGFSQVMLKANDLVGHPGGLQAAVQAVRDSGLRGTGFQVLRDFEGLSGHLHHYQDFRLALFPRRGGHAPELDDADTLAWLGRFLGRMHAHGAVAPYHLRPTLDPDSYGEASLRCVQEQAQLPYDLAGPYEQAARQALDEVRRAFDRAGDISWRRVHGDCHVGNILWTQEGPHFVDLDDSCMAPALQDLWMLLSGNRAQQQAQLLELIVGYEDFCDFDRRELHLLEALRTLRLLHYSAWLTRRREDPAFVVAFPWFDTAQYWQERIAELQQQLEAMREAPLCV